MMIEAGVADYAFKPFTADIIQAKIHQVMQGR
jgi:DNA-binding response OmpR family regulator